MKRFQDDLEQRLAENEELKILYEREMERRKLRIALTKLRIESGLTQKAFAKKIGTQQANVSRMENGTHDPSYKQLCRIAKAMGKELCIEFRDKQTETQEHPAAASVTVSPTEFEEKRFGGKRVAGETIENVQPIGKRFVLELAGTFAEAY